MKAAVTGATGLLGSHIVERLIELGHEVRALARRTSDIRHLKTTDAYIITCDVEDYDSLRTLVQGVDIVFHCAAKVMPGWGRWQEFESCNVKGTENMLNVSAEAGVSRFLYVSSGDVYGHHGTTDTRADESTPCEVEFNRYSYYAYSKLLADRLAQEYHKQGRLPITILRGSGIYGPRDRLLTDRFYELVKSPIVVWPGNANPRTTVTYATDVAELAILAATSEVAAGQIYNVATAEEQDWRGFAAALARAMGKSEKQWGIPMGLLYAAAFMMEKWGWLWRFREPPFLTRAELLNFQEGMYLDGSKARKELGWDPKITMEQGSRLYVEWRRAQKK
jgi:nucleoside-diphosphate-sugar epimerase